MSEQTAVVKRLPPPAPNRVEVYKCPQCKQWRPYCDGCADDQPEICDSCWSKLHGKGGSDHLCDECAPWVHHLRLALAAEKKLIVSHPKKALLWWVLVCVLPGGIIAAVLWMTWRLLRRFVGG